MSKEDVYRNQMSLLPRRTFLGPYLRIYFSKIRRVNKNGQTTWTPGKGRLKVGEKGRSARMAALQQFRQK